MYSVYSVVEKNQFADVVLPLPVEHPFTYEVPHSLRERVAVGMRAVVPVLNRVETGYIVGLKSNCEIANVRPLLDLPDPTPVFSKEMLELSSWIADYYCCTLGEALQSAVPAGMRIKSKLRYTLVPEQVSAGRFTDRQRKVIAALYGQGPMTEGQLAKVAGATALSNTLQSLVKRGVLLVETAVGEGRVNALTETWVQLVETAIPAPEALADMQRKAPRQAAVYLDLLHGEPVRQMSVLCEKHGATSAAIAALEKKGLVEKMSRELFRSPDYTPDARAQLKLNLNAEQAAAYEAITGMVGASQYGTFLLHGVTGSGKTEVYLQAIEHTLQLGRNAILLVPEISLTPQTVGRLFGRFQERIAVLHSGLSTGERYDEWRRAQRGEVRIVVGARSAIFAPVPDVGIIIVDEEHDGSYKQSEVPRYHARDVAVMRAKRANAVCVLGSATPSLESYHNSESGKFTRLEILNRATQSPLPEVQIVDMRDETREHGPVVLSNVLEEEVMARVAAGEQVILLMNRRGFSPFVMCPKCGWTAECSSCNVSLTYHASGGFLSCHYCNEQTGVPGACAECGFDPLLFLGTGTQKVEDILMRSFPGARIERMDADTTSGKGGHAKILGRFAAGEIDILIGTQMIAKGHDYPGVTLVGVISADTSLSVPDFRAAEQTFQLLTQVAGRAGRGDRAGKVIIQTYRPKHYSVQAAANHDYTAFYEREIAERRNAAYPPAKRMANLAIESEDAQAAERAIMRLHRLVREQMQAQGLEGVEILGPAPASIHKVKKRYRWNLGLLSKSTKRLNALARATRTAFEAEADKAVLLKVDLDPYGVF